MSTMTTLEALNHFFNSKFPTLILVVGLVVIGFVSTNHEKRISHVEDGIEDLRNRVFKIEVRLSVIEENIREMKSEIKEMKSEIKEIKEDISEMKGDVKALLKMQH